MTKPEWTMRRAAGWPRKEGWYHVLHPGDSESIDGHTIYSFGDYPSWAYWTPSPPDEIDFEEDRPGNFTTQHDEDGDMIIAWYGPIDVPGPLK